MPGARVAAHLTAADAENRHNAVDVALSDSLGRYAMQNGAPTATTTGRTYYVTVDRTGFVTSSVRQLIVQPDPAPDDHFAVIAVMFRACVS